ncbi:hypothetical protein C8R45DRAFT_1183519 [Mycena sanguinolenta]|nr:hypothetical protein C8R45DRAFT_1183519 [Mycena sanguinolenta]
MSISASRSAPPAHVFATRPRMLAQIAEPAPRQHPALTSPSRASPSSPSPSSPPSPPPPPTRRTMHVRQMRHAAIRVPSAFATATVPRYCSSYYISVSQRPKTALAVVKAELREPEEAYGLMGWTGGIPRAWLIPYTNTGGRTGEGGTAVEGPTHQRYRDGYESGDVERALDPLPRPNASASGAVVEMCAAGAEMTGSTISLSVGAGLEVAALPSVVARPPRPRYSPYPQMCSGLWRSSELSRVACVIDGWGTLALVEVVRAVRLEELHEFICDIALAPLLGMCTTHYGLRVAGGVGLPLALALPFPPARIPRWRAKGPSTPWHGGMPLKKLRAVSSHPQLAKPARRSRRISRRR